MTRIVTLLTDFGVADPYVAELKGAMLRHWGDRQAPEPWPRFVDLCHKIPAGDIEAAAWFLQRVAPIFAAGTTHLVVVDPGVGSERPLIAVAARGQFFVGPGNGVLAFLGGDPEAQIVRLDRTEHHHTPQGEPASTTFQGRDVFAPVAAHLALGRPLADVGSMAGVNCLGRLEVRSTTDPEAPERLGKVVWIDGFGNLITDIRQGSTDGRVLAAGAGILVAGRLVRGPFATFAAGPASDPFWYWGSGGTLEVAVQGRSAAATFGWKRGLAILRAKP
jgi:S-adenosylmethionine hydrolase